MLLRHFAPILVTLSLALYEAAGAFANEAAPAAKEGKPHIALLLPLSGRAAPIGQSMQQAAEMALFDTGAKELAKKGNLKTVYEQNYPPTTTDFSSLIRAIRGRPGSFGALDLFRG